jgi:hypothetical protein
MIFFYPEDSFVRTRKRILLVVVGERNTSGSEQACHLSGAFFSAKDA